MERITKKELLEIANEASEPDATVGGPAGSPPPQSPRTNRGGGGNGNNRSPLILVLLSVAFTFSSLIGWCFSFADSSLKKQDFAGWQELAIVVLTIVIGAQLATIAGLIAHKIGKLDVLLAIIYGALLLVLGMLAGVLWNGIIITYLFAVGLAAAAIDITRRIMSKKFAAVALTVIAIALVGTWLYNQHPSEPKRKAAKTQVEQQTPPAPKAKNPKAEAEAQTKQKDSVTTKSKADLTPDSKTQKKSGLETAQDKIYDVQMELAITGAFLMILFIVWHFVEKQDSELARYRKKFFVGSISAYVVLYLTITYFVRSGGEKMAWILIGMAAIIIVTISIFAFAVGPANKTAQKSVPTGGTADAVRTGFAAWWSNFIKRVGVITIGFPVAIIGLLVFIPPFRGVFLNNVVFIISIWLMLIAIEFFWNSPNVSRGHAVAYALMAILAIGILWKIFWGSPTPRENAGILSPTGKPLALNVPDVMQGAERIVSGAAKGAWDGLVGKEQPQQQAAIPGQPAKPALPRILPTSTTTDVPFPDDDESVILPAPSTVERTAENAAALASAIPPPPPDINKAIEDAFRGVPEQDLLIAKRIPYPESRYRQFDANGKVLKNVSEEAVRKGINVYGLYQIRDTTYADIYNRYHKNNMTWEEFQKFYPYQESAEANARFARELYERRDHTFVDWAASQDDWRFDGYIAASGIAMPTYRLVTAPANTWSAPHFLPSRPGFMPCMKFTQTERLHYEVMALPTLTSKRGKYIYDFTPETDSVTIKEEFWGLRFNSRTGSDIQIVVTVWFQRPGSPCAL